MIWSTLLNCVLTSAILPATNPTPTPVCVADRASEDVVVKAIEMWLKLYRTGKLDVPDEGALTKGKPRSKKTFVSIKLGILPESRLAAEGPEALTHFRELQELCKRAAKLGTAEAVDALIEVAAVGADGKKVDVTLVPSVVSQVGDEALSEIRSDAARNRLAELAKSGSETERIAALRALGWGKREEDRPTFEAALGDESLEVRRAAAKGLSRAVLPNAIESLADRLQREENELALGDCIDALVATIDTLESGEQHQRVLRRAATSAIRLLGKHSWQVDLATIQLMERVRAADSVPALIDLLQRWVEADDSSKLGETSGLVRESAYELLVSLSGATFPKDRPDQWKEWWERVHDEFKVVDLAEVKAKQKAHRTSTGSFFGIPVRGSHVLFICDFSGSMEWPSADVDEESGKQISKMEVARRELKGAIHSMAADGHFGLVHFATDAEAWNKKLLEASAANKKKFDKFIDKARPLGGTNVWGGLKIGFDMKGNKTEGKVERYDSNVDEIFILSDGAPSFGEIIDPEQILAAVRQANAHRRIRINTVFIEGPEDEQKMKDSRIRYPFTMSGKELMRRLAEQNGGIYIEPGETRLNR
ncbi:MAG: HEAT repeat domain-containing protein [Planctomycetes bacterium]|nr:HEAT repeat domain-containing protein [Planctomycetota bacterium]